MKATVLKQGTRLSDVLSKMFKPFDVTIKDDAGDPIITITGTWDPQSYTTAFEDEMQGFLADERPGNAIRLSAARMIKEWDLLGDDDKPIPLQPVRTATGELDTNGQPIFTEIDYLAAVPTKFLGLLIKELGANAGPPTKSSGTRGSFVSPQAG